MSQKNRLLVLSFKCCQEAAHGLGKCAGWCLQGGFWGHVQSCLRYLSVDSRIFCPSVPCRETVLAPRKRLAGAAEPDRKGLAGKRTKAKNSGEASANVESSSPPKTSASKNCGKTLSIYWLMKPVPESRLEKGVDVKFSMEDLKAQPKQRACRDGSCSCQARNVLRARKLEEEAFFYQSSCKEPGITAIVETMKQAYPEFEKNRSLL